MTNVGTDETWHVMEEASERLSLALQDGETLEVVPIRRSTGFATVTEGLFCGDKWIDVFEPVRQRRCLSRTWTGIQSAKDAAQGIELFLRERPDQRAQ